MILPKESKIRQVQAGLKPSWTKSFCVVSFGCNVKIVRLRRFLVLFYGAGFRNPSPWRQSGASMHALPPFFLGAFAKRNFERDKLCQRQQRFSQRLRFPFQWLAVCLPLIHKFRTLPVAQHLARQRLPLLAATQAKLSQAASSVRLLARLSRIKPTVFFNSAFAVELVQIANAACPISGRVAFSRF